MEYTIRWKDMNEDTSIIPYLEEKLNKLLKDFVFVEDGFKIEYVLHNSTKTYMMRLNVNIHKANAIRSEGEGYDLNKATTECIDKTLDQLRKIKTQVNSSKN